MTQTEISSIVSEYKVDFNDLGLKTVYDDFHEAMKQVFWDERHRDDPGHIVFNVKRQRVF